MADELAKEYKTSSPKASSPKDPASSTSPPREIETAPGDLEADPDFDDDGFDDRLSSYTESLSSSVLNFPKEYGRQYHAYRAGAYNFPNDEREMQRLDMTHIMFLRALGGELFLAPIDREKVQRVLDIGTGTGSWSIDVGDLLSGAEVIGNDLSPVQTNWVPPNVKFEVDDVESEWTYDSKFDFIFSRYMAASIADWPRLVKRVYDNLAPGGWAEFQDYDFTWRSDDGTLNPNFHTFNWAKAVIATIEGPVIGRDCCPGPKLKKWAEEVGFINLYQKIIKIPVGPWAKDPLLKDLGMINLAQLLEGLEGLSLKPLAAAGYKEEETLALVAKVRSELKSKAFHSYYTFYVVYGQKPA